MQISSNWETGGLVLSLPHNLPDLQKHAKQALQLGLLPKPTFHFTILGSKTKKQILEHRQELSNEAKNQLLCHLELLAKNYDWQVTMQDEFYVLQQEYCDDDTPEIRTTIIQIAKIPMVQTFYAELEQLLAMQFELPHTHITIYSGSTRADKMLRGIGVYSQEQFKRVAKERLL